MKRRHLLFKINCLTLILLCLSGCNADSINRVKENSIAVKEYNEAIKLYNKVALSFTGLARDVDKEFEEKEAFDKKFWDDCNNSRKKVIDSISMLKSFKFRYEDNEKVMDKINPMLENVEIYMAKLDDFQKTGQYDNWKNFKESNTILYGEILNQSTEISRLFDVIYDEFIIKKKE